MSWTLNGTSLCICDADDSIVNNDCRYFDEYLDQEADDKQEASQCGLSHMPNERPTPSFFYALYTLKHGIIAFTTRSRYSPPNSLQLRRLVPTADRSGCSMQNVVHISAHEGQHVECGKQSTANTEANL